MLTITHGSTEHNNKFLEKCKTYIIVAIYNNYHTILFSHCGVGWAAGSYISDVDSMFSGSFTSQLHALLSGSFWARDLTAQHLDFLICRNGIIIEFLL